MSLFVVNRYEDKDWNEEQSGEKDHLSVLLNKIQERKRLRESAAVSAPPLATENQTQTQDQAAHKVKKKRKKNQKDEKKEAESKPVEPVPEDTTTTTTKQAKENQVKSSFTVLGSHKRSKAQTAKRVLPAWLTQPKIISSDLKSGPTLEEAALEFMDPELVQKLKNDGFDRLFPVQAQVFSWLLESDESYRAGRWLRDTCVSMPTGSGKTLAYTLPLIQVLKNSNSFVRCVRCLIVLPVQELAAQVYDVVAKYSSNSSLKVALVSGASSFKEEQEKLLINSENVRLSKVDIVVATPGRLIDHIRKTSGFSLANLRFLVIDEADRSTDWLQYLPFPHQRPPVLTVANTRDRSKVPAQKILLSATLSQDPEKLSALGLFWPILFTSAVLDFEELDSKDKDLNLDLEKSSYGNPSELTEKILECREVKYKPLAVYKLIIDSDVKTLVFTNSGESAHRLSILLRSLLSKLSKDIVVSELSAQLGSKQREETLDKFRRGAIQVLVSSDALARGLDIEGIKLVVSYDMPKHVKGYIHRAGRTGRGGFTGTAVSLLSPGQVDAFVKMINKVGKSVPEMLESNNKSKYDFDDIARSVEYEEQLEVLKTSLTEEQEATSKRRKRIKRITRGKFQ